MLALNRLPKLGVRNCHFSILPLVQCLALLSRLGPVGSSNVTPLSVVDLPVQEFDAAMKNANLAAEMLDAEEKKNPGGKWQRKKMIDWTAWRRRYGTQVSAMARSEEMEFSIDSFVEDRISKGDTREKALQRWGEYKANKDIAREGEGASLILWIPQARRRIRDKTTYIDNSVAEGTRQHKDVSAEDGEALKQFCHSSQRDHDNAFFRGAHDGQFARFGESVHSGEQSVAAASTQPLPLKDIPGAAEGEPPYPKKRKKVDVLGSRNALFSSQDKDITTLVLSMNATSKKAKDAFDEGATLLTGDSCMQNYLQVVTVRRLFLRFWGVWLPEALRPGSPEGTEAQKKTPALPASSAGGRESQAPALLNQELEKGPESSSLAAGSSIEPAQKKRKQQEAAPVAGLTAGVETVTEMQEKKKEEEEEKKKEEEEEEEKKDEHSSSKEQDEKEEKLDEAAMAKIAPAEASEDVA